MEELDRYHIRQTEWKLEPLENPQHDFVTDLLEKYLADLTHRQHLGNVKNARMSDLIRKPVQLDSVEKQINILYKET
jgi:hypothetical protein